MKQLLFFFFCLLFFGLAFFFLTRKDEGRISLPLAPLPPLRKLPTLLQQVREKAAAALPFAQRNGLSTDLAFLLDMRRHSGRNRFFVYDFQKDSLLDAALVAHGGCNTAFLERPQFSNVPGCGCSSVGRYKIGASYNGNFGKAFKLHGLDSTNTNAYDRYIVLHGYEAVPALETFPHPIVNSLGCPMVNYTFLEKLTRLIEAQEKPVLLWMYY